MKAIADLDETDRSVTLERLLRESEARFDLMADHAPVMLWKANTTGDCDFFNRRWLEFTGRTLEQELGVGWASGVHPEDFQDCMDTFLAAFVERRSFRMEYRLRRVDGAFRVILDQGVPRFEADGSFAGYVGSCIDVTEMREAANSVARLNTELQRRVTEREVLLRELHHRVKNNLQLISSILNLQARFLHGDAKALFEEGQTRVHAIALVHEKLCASESMTDVDLVAYARDLATIIRHALGDTSRIDLVVEGSSTQVAADQAVPCGLLINELVTNAFKHAFPHGRAGTIVVGVTPLPDKRIKLFVKDNGVGLPELVDTLLPSTLGLDLVATLARQLDASLEIMRMGGTTVVLTLPLQGHGAP
jgi:PAS domain S-box-containing protein